MNRLLPCLLLLLSSFASANEPRWNTSLSSALEEAQAKKKLVLVDFQAPWCYSCYYMEQKVLSGRRFADASKEMLLVKLDVDKEEGHGLEAKHAVTMLPAYLVLDGSGKELGRVMGEQTEDDFVSALKGIVGGSQAKASECAFAYAVMEAKDPSKAELEKQKAKLEDLAKTRLFVPEPKRCADFRSGVEALAEVYEKLGEKDKRAKLLDDALAQLEPSRDPGEDRNRDDNVRFFLMMKKDDAALRRWYGKLIEAYPADYVYSYRYATYLEGQGKAKEALPWIERADKLSYGANRLQVTLVRAKVLSALGRKDEARKLAQRDLKAAGGRFPTLEKPLSDWLSAQK
jgi:thioredoxin-related protein